jgi:hypothetical protein
MLLRESCDGLNSGGSILLTTTGEELSITAFRATLLLGLSVHALHISPAAQDFPAKNYGLSRLGHELVIQIHDPVL